MMDQLTPTNFTFNKENLTAGNEYGFTVVAFNFNGFGPASEMKMLKSCTVPSGQ